MPFPLDPPLWGIQIPYLVLAAMVLKQLFPIPAPALLKKTTAPDLSRLPASFLILAYFPTRPLFLKCPALRCCFSACEVSSFEVHSQPPSARFLGPNAYRIFQLVCDGLQNLNLSGVVPYRVSCPLPWHLTHELIFATRRIYFANQQLPILSATLLPQSWADTAFKVVAVNSLILVDYVIKLGENWRHIYIRIYKPQDFPIKKGLGVFLFTTQSHPKLQASFT